MQIPESAIFQTERELKLNFIQEGFYQGEGSKEAQLPNEIQQNAGRLGGSVSKMSGFSSGHDLTDREFEPCVGLCVDRSEPGARFGFYGPLSLHPTPVCALSLSVFQK